MASAIVAAAEQLLERHGRRGLLAAIALLGALLWQGAHLLPAGGSQLGCKQCLSWLVRQ